MKPDGGPPYCISHDTTLRARARENQSVYGQSVDELTTVSGLPTGAGAGYVSVVISYLVIGI